MRIAAPAFALITTAWLLTCHSGGETGLVEQTVIPPSPLELATEQVDRFASELSRHVDTRLARLEAAALERALADSPVLARFDQPIPELVRELYAERAYAPVFLVDDRLSDNGRVLLETLRNAWDHAMVPADYGVDVAAEALTRLEVAGAALEEMESLTLTPAERQALTEFLAGRPDLLDLDASALQEELTAVVLDPPEGEGSPLPRLHLMYQHGVQALATSNRATLDIELALAAGFLRYAYDMRFFNSAWFPRDIRDNTELLEGAVREALLASFRTGVTTGFEPVLAALPPHHEQYGRLLTAQRRYREWARLGGWETDLEEVELQLGRSNDMVPRLRQRLHAEGYFDGDLESREYDRELRSALQLYQRTHQYREDGRLAHGEVDSLNVSAMERARQIAVTLRRWRESGIGHEDYYVVLNIPDFHAEVWRDGHRDMRFRVIVGSTERFVSRTTGELVFPRATPELDRYMRYIVFNPYWNVPLEIMYNEYDPNLEEDPFWYENNGYEVLYNEYGQRWVRQLPGPDNALGQVKFLFPNEHDVYMHDTPLRHLFNRSIRAFSHGCMRIQDPMELAEYILGHDRGWDRDRIDATRADGAEQWVTLRHPIPVHVDYYVVRVDDDGHANFLADLYRRDRPRMAAVVQDELRAAMGDAESLVHVGLALAHSQARLSAELALANQQDPDPSATTETASD